MLHNRCLKRHLFGPCFRHCVTNLCTTISWKQNIWRRCEKNEIYRISDHRFSTILELKPVYSWIKMPITWLLIPWLHPSSCHQLPWCSLRTIDCSLSFARNEFKQNGRVANTNSYSQVPLKHSLIYHDITYDTAITVAEGESNLESQQTIVRIL